MFGLGNGVHFDLSAHDYMRFARAVAANQYCFYAAGKSAKEDSLAACFVFWGVVSVDHGPWLEN